MDHEGSAIQGDHEQSVTLGKSRSQAQGRVTGKDREIVTQERSMRGVLEGRLGDAKDPRWVEIRANQCAGVWREGRPGTRQPWGRISARLCHMESCGTHVNLILKATVTIK